MKHLRKAVNRIIDLCERDNRDADYTVGVLQYYLDRRTEPKTFNVVKKAMKK